MDLLLHPGRKAGGVRNPVQECQHDTAGTDGKARRHRNAEIGKRALVSYGFIGRDAKNGFGGDVAGHVSASCRDGTARVVLSKFDQITQRAIVVQDGFLWNGARYDSLSAIAFAITGTRWSGPRFFGLRDSTVGGEDGP
jgi:hypothetical protein